MNEIKSIKHIQAPVHAAKSDIVSSAWNVVGVNSEYLLVGSEIAVREAVELINAAAELPFEILEGEEDAAPSLHEDGDEFETAVKRLKEFGQVDYLSWYCWRSDATTDFFLASLKDNDRLFSVTAPSAFKLIEMIHLLETNGVTEPEQGEAVIE